MLSRHVWAFRLLDQDHEFFESCGAAIRSLIERGARRADITIDFQSASSLTRARETAARFVAVYGVDGAKFMPDGNLPMGDECPPRAGGIEEHRALRKRVLVCPHCGKPIRADGSK